MSYIEAAMCLLRGVMDVLQYEEYCNMTSITPPIFFILQNSGQSRPCCKGVGHSIFRYLFRIFCDLFFLVTGVDKRKVSWHIPALRIYDMLIEINWCKDML